MWRYIVIVFMVSVAPLHALAASTEEDVKSLRNEIEALKAASIIPTGTIIFVQTSKCPITFSEFVPARGRVIVGLQANGVPAAQVGVEMSDREPRNTLAYHQHSLIIPSHSHEVPNLTTWTYNEGPPSQIAGGHGFQINPSATGNTSTNPAQQIVTDFSGTQNQPSMPYVQLMACIKN